MPLTLILAYILLANVIGLVLMAWDKRQSRLNGWRIAEKTLLGLAVLGGSIGVYCGMRLFRHKTLHLQFSIGVPVIIVAQVAAVIWWLRR